MGSSQTQKGTINSLKKNFCDISMHFFTEFSGKILQNKNKYVNLHSYRRNGALAHLARAFDWQSRGDEFESRMLHKKLKVLKTNEILVGF